MMRTLPAQWTTERLRIASAAADDVEELYAAFDACTYVEAFDPTFKAVPVAEVEAVVRRSLALGSDGWDGFHLLGIRLRETRELLGYFHLSYGVPEPAYVWISIFVLHPRHQGGGYGAEVVRGLLAELRRLEAYEVVRLRVYLKNWTALRFWIGRGFTRIVRYEGAAVHAPESAASLMLETRLHPDAE